MHETVTALRRPGVLVAFLLVAATLAGCDDDGSPRAAGPKTPSGSASTSASPEPTSTVAPATGPEITTSRFSFRVPEGFVERPVAGEFLGSAVDLLPDDEIYFGIIEDFGEETLDGVTDSYLRHSPFHKRPDVLPPMEIDGLTVFHVAGPINDRSYGEAFGTLVDGDAVTIQFQMHSPAARRKEIVESTLETLHWR